MSPQTAHQSKDVELKPVAPHHPSMRSTGGAPRSVSNQTVKAKETSRTQPSPSYPPAKQTKQPQSTTAVPAQSQMKKLTRKSSKPIINWFQRKLGGSVRSRRASDADALRATRPVKEKPSLKEQRRRSSVPSVPPLPLIQTQSKKGSKGSQGLKPDPVLIPKRNTISLDGSDDYNSYMDGRTIDSFDDHRGSVARESLWSPTSLSVREADEDASVRPIPPSAPPSPSPSHSSSSYLSDPRTFASMAASTKPTTLLSVDLTGGGMAHIAQAPPTPTLPAHRLAPHARANSTTPSTVGSITFSALPAATSPRLLQSSPGTNSRTPLQHGTLNAPQHTAHHPRYNPRPSSPPPDDASVLTLASSAFGLPTSRMGMNALNGRRSLADDSFSHISGAPGLGDSVSHFHTGDLDGDDDRLMEADRDGDVDASVRALRPRSSRRGSWESEASGWSAHLGNGTPGAPSVLRDRSLWTTPSVRTGTRSVNLWTEEECHDKSDITHEDDRSLAFTTSEVFHGDASDNHSEKVLAQQAESDQSSLQDVSEHLQSSSQSSSDIIPGGPGTVTPRREKGQETPRVSILILEEILPAHAPTPTVHVHDARAQEGNVTA
ncbi:hypothetical protein BC835DRAFT_1325942 [Cytidiella melzeri]|nr:hypothetical protein BC835DRAFT_1325942 [Cytidiella melzeri]